MRSIKNKAQTLEARIAAAEERARIDGKQDEALQAEVRAWERAAVVTAALCGGRPSPEAIARMIELGIEQGQARRFAEMGFEAARDEVTREARAVTERNLI